MSSLFAKGTKRKRTRSSSDETNHHSSEDSVNSFVKNVTTRVTRLLPNITKWFNPSSTNTNGSAPMADSSDSSTEDEASEPAYTQPPAKLMRYSNTQLNNVNTVDKNFAVTSDTLQSSIKLNSVHITPRQSGLRQDAVFPHTKTLNPTEKVVIEKSDGDIASNNINSQSHSLGKPTKRKSLIDFHNQSCSNSTLEKQCEKMPNCSISNLSQPYSTPGLLGSPFYSGTTMYGGAASTYINQPNIQQRKTAVVKANVNETVTLSSSVRRVMDLMEQFSSPLSDAKRIPSYRRTPKTNNVFIRSDNDSSRRDLNQTYKTQELPVPSYASLFQLKARSRIMDSTAAARRLLASRSSTVGSAPYSIINQRNSDEKANPSKLNAKVQSRSIKTLLGAKDDFSEIAPPLNLPNITLEIDKNNLPKFNLDKSTLTKPTYTNNSVPNKDSSILETSIKLSSDNELVSNKLNTADPLFKFSGPIILDTETYKFLPVNKRLFISEPCLEILNSDKTKSSERITPNSHEYSKSLKCSDSGTISKLNNYICLRCENEGEEQRGQICSNCKLVNNPTVSIACTNCHKNETNTYNQTKTTARRLSDIESDKTNDKQVMLRGSKSLGPKSGALQISKSDTQNSDDTLQDSKSVIQNTCDKFQVSKSANQNTNLHDSKSVPQETDTLQNTKSLVQNIDFESVAQSSEQKQDIEWKCDDCWIKNKNSVDKCIACGAGKSAAKITQIPSVIAQMPINNTEWTCNVCWIKNKNNVDKCIACNGLRTKPGKCNDPNKNIKTDDKWKCNDCWIKNEDSAEKCAACGAPRPGSKPETISDKSPHNGYNNKMKSQKESWSCPQCFVFNSNNKIKCACCDTPNPVTVQGWQKATFNFGLKSDTTFKFGIDPKTQNTSVADVPEIKMIAHPTPKIADNPETNNNILPKAPTFNFGMPSNKSEEKVHVIKPKSNPISFGFDTSKRSSDIVLPTIVKNETSDKEKAENSNKKDETIQEVPVVDLISETNKSSESKEQPESNNDIHPTKVQNKEESNPPIANNTAVESAPFKFSANIGTPVANIFGASPNTTAIFTSPAPTTIASPAFFQKSDLSAVSSIFGNNDKSKTTLFTTTVTTTAVSAPVFSFGSKGQIPQSQSETPKFNFTYGNSNKSETSNNTGLAAVKFSIPSNNNILKNNSLENENGLKSSTVANLPGNISRGNVLPNNPLLPTNGVNVETLPTGSSDTPTVGLFGSSVQKDAIWGPNSNPSTNIFAPNTSTFTFGSNNMSYNIGQNPLLGIPNQNTNNMPSLFSSPIPSQPSQSIFGTPQPAGNTAPTHGIFGAPHEGAAPNFVSPNVSVPTFDVAVSPTYNFGTPQTTGIFGFGQQQTQLAQSPTPTVFPSFNMGSTNNTAMRPMRKAVRRSTKR